MKQAQLKQPIVIITDPLIECWRLTPPLCWFWVLLLPCVPKSPSTGPFINVMTMAPATVAKVPTTFAWLRVLFIFILSSLNRSNKNRNAQVKFQIDCCYLFYFLWKWVRVPLALFLLINLLIKKNSDRLHKNSIRNSLTGLAYSTKLIRDCHFI